MILSIIITILCSLAIILLCHRIWEYLQDNFSTKKTKYLVNSQMEKYKNIMAEIQTNSVIENKSSDGDFFIDMKDDLEDFLKNI